MNHTIEYSDLVELGKYEHISVFASSFGKGKSKRLESVAFHDFHTGTTSHCYCVVVDKVTVFETDSLEEAIKEYNKR